MNDNVPRLDDIEFDELVELARGDIARYAPDWTDHNLHDPGMTLIDLLAWIVDQQIFRAGFVGGRHRRAFAALLGQGARGPQPARGLIWPSRPLSEGRFIQAGSPVTCSQHTEPGFALEWPEDAVADGPEPGPLYLPPVALTTIGLAVDGVERLTPSPRTGGSWAMGNGGQLAGSALSLRFDGPLGPPDRQASVSLGIEVAPPPGPPLSPGDRPWGPVAYSYRVGAAPWVELTVVHDGTAGLATTGAVILEVPPVEATGTGGSELRLALDRGFFPVPPQLRAASINVMPVVQRTYEPPASLGRGTGGPDQVVELDTADLVRPPSRVNGPVLEITVAAPGPEQRPERWEERSDLARSGPDDAHYVVRPGHLLFGNGVNGRRPANGAQIAHTGLARTRGAAGNVRPGLSWTVPALNAEGTAYGCSRQAMTGGTDGTGAGGLEIAARVAATHRSALLTDEELVTAARSLTGLAVGRAEVVAGFDQRLPGRCIDGVRTLVVVPHQQPWIDGDHPPGLVQASQEYLDEVAARLAPRRVLGERLVVQGPVVVAVDVWVTITMEPGRTASDVRIAVRRAVHSRLSVLGASGTNARRPLGRDLSVAEVEAIAAAVPGVATVARVGVAMSGHPSGGGPIPVPRDGLVVADRVEVLVETADRGHVAHRSSCDGGGGPT